MNKDNYSNFSTGERIKLSRIKRNISQIELSRMLTQKGFSISKWSMNRLENDNRQYSAQELSLIGDILGVSPSWLALGNQGAEIDGIVENNTQDLYPENISNLESALLLSWRTKNINVLVTFIGMIASDLLENN